MRYRQALAAPAICLQPTDIMWCLILLLLAKALGGGMPLGAFISSNEIMSVLASDPPLGHITTFGGHPVCCAAGDAALSVIIEEKLAETCNIKSALFQREA